jgi:predicted ArsR family transcriptional regulator
MLFRMDRAASILGYCSEAPLSVSELSAKVKGNHEKTILLIRDLKERHLLQSYIAKRRVRGRPNQMLRTTILGEQYVREYRQLADLRLFSNDNDIKKALHQADLAAKLDEQKISPYARFQEINELARNIARTAQT